MALIKCPRCELNYMNDTDEMCSVCRRDLRGDSDQDDMIEICTECGENPVVAGYDLCATCLKELQRRTADDNDGSDEVVVREDPGDIGIDSVSTMDEIDIDIGGDINDPAFADEEADFDDDDEEEDEEKESDEKDGDDFDDDGE